MVLLLFVLFLFAQATILTSSDNNRSKGCGIVRYQKSKEAERAIRELNDSTLDGRTIFVRQDREQNTKATNGSGDSQASSQLFVGNLSYETSWQGLKDYFRQCGNVDHSEVVEDADGKKKGFGIIRFFNSKDASDAIRRLDGVEFQGRRLEVRWDRSSSAGFDGSSSRNARGGGGGMDAAGGSQLFVGNLSYETSWQNLKDHFRQCGDVDHAEVVEDGNGKKKGFGTVRFFNSKDANDAIRRLDGGEFQGRRLEVRWDRSSAGVDGSSSRNTRNGDGDGGGMDAAGGSQLFVGNLSYETSWQDLKDHFRQCGDVDHAEAVESADGMKKGFGTVRFFNSKDANDAIRRLDGVEFKGRRLEVRWDRSSGRGDGSNTEGYARRGGGAEDQGHSKSKKQHHSKSEPQNEAVENVRDIASALDSALGSSR
jgi:RNA recognition motif-containing protein